MFYTFSTCPTILSLFFFLFPFGCMFVVCAWHVSCSAVSTITIHWFLVCIPTHNSPSLLQSSICWFSFFPFFLIPDFPPVIRLDHSKCNVYQQRKPGSRFAWMQLVSVSSCLWCSASYCKWTSLLLCTLWKGSWSSSAFPWASTLLVFGSFLSTSCVCNPGNLVDICSNLVPV